MQDTAAQRGAFRVIGLLVLGAALYVVKRGPWLTGLAVVLALPVVVLSIWLAFDFDLRRQAIMAALSAVFYFYAAGLIAYMLEDEFASADELFAAGATFTLLAWAFAYVYLVCARRHHPASADGAGARHDRGVLGGDVSRSRRVPVDCAVRDDTKGALSVRVPGMYRFPHCT